MTEPREGALRKVVLADVVLTYAYVFVADALVGTPDGPHAPAWYWFTQIWVYVLIAPIAAVASWRGARQVLDAWAGRARWWRLSLEGAAIGGGLALLLGLSVGPEQELGRAVLDAVILSGALGLVLTAANYLLARAVALPAHAAPAEQAG